MFKRIAEKIKNIFNRIKKTGFKKALPLFYLFVLILSIILTLVYAFIPKFIACSSLFGEQFCTPFGIYLGLLISFPGYIVSGNILSFVKDLPWGISFFIVVTTSFLFYFLTGLIIDNFKGKPLNAENISKLLIIILFPVLLLFLMTLL